MSPSDLQIAVLVLHVAATLYMVGLIWFVQHVHYPLYAAVGDAAFRAYEQSHMTRTTTVVGPPMLLEAATAVALVVWPVPGVPGGAAWLGLGLLASVWLSTLGLQVPRHADLANGFDARAHSRLVATNWIRTAAWSLRGALVLWMVFGVMAGVTT